MAETDRDWLFDILVELSDHTHEQGMTEVSQRLEDALDALVTYRRGADVVPFRSVRALLPPPVREFVPHQMRVSGTG